MCGNGKTEMDTGTGGCDPGEKRKAAGFGCGRFRKNGGAESSLGLIIDVVGKTQQIADTVCALVRSRMLHCDYPGRKTTAGNLAFPFSPSDIHVGAVYAFSVFHLALVDSLLETSQISLEEIGK